MLGLDPAAARGRSGAIRGGAHPRSERRRPGLTRRRAPVSGGRNARPTAGPTVSGAPELRCPRSQDRGCSPGGPASASVRRRPAMCSPIPRPGSHPQASGPAREGTPTRRTVAARGRRMECG
jgi:hypothetical protein